MQITTRDQVTKGLRVRFVEGYEPFSLANKYLAESDVIYVRETKVHNDSYGYYINLESADGLNGSYGYIKDLIIDEREESELPYFEVLVDRGEEGTETIGSFLKVIDAHHFINKERKNYAPHNLKFDKWQIIDGVVTKLNLHNI